MHTAHSGGSSSSSSCCKRCTTFCSVVSSSKSQSEQRSSSSLAAAASMTRWVPATDWRSAPTAHPHSRHDRIPTLYSTCTQTRPARGGTPLDDVIARAARQLDPPASQRATPDARAFGLDDYRAFFSGPLVCSYHSPPTDERCFCLHVHAQRGQTWLGIPILSLARSYDRIMSGARTPSVCIVRSCTGRSLDRLYVAPHTTTAPAVCFFSGRPSHIPSNLYTYLYRVLCARAPHPHQHERLSGPLSPPRPRARRHRSRERASERATHLPSRKAQSTSVK